MENERKTTRLWFATALVLYLVWIGALAALAVLSASRPAANRSPQKGLTMASIAAISYREGEPVTKDPQARTRATHENTTCDEPLGRSKQTTTAPAPRCTVFDLS